MLGGEVGGKRNLDKLRGSSWSLSVEAWSCSKAEEVEMGRSGGDRQTDRDRDGGEGHREGERETEKQKENKKVRRKEVDGQEKEERERAGGRVLEGRILVSRRENREARHPWGHQGVGRDLATEQQ